MTPEPKNSPYNGIWTPAMEGKLMASAWAEIFRKNFFNQPKHPPGHWWRRRAALNQQYRRANRQFQLDYNSSLKQKAKRAPEPPIYIEADSLLKPNIIGTETLVILGNNLVMDPVFIVMDSAS